MLRFVGKVGSQDRTGVGVEERQLRDLSLARARLAALPAPFVSAIAASREGGRLLGRGVTTSPAAFARARTAARSSPLARTDESNSFTSALTDRPSAAARAFSSLCRRSSMRVMSCRMTNMIADEALSAIRLNAGDIRRVGGPRATLIPVPHLRGRYTLAR